jgi:hypothetical protein
MAEAADATTVAATGRDEEIGRLMEALSETSQTPTIAKNSEYMTAASGVKQRAAAARARMN